MAVSSDQRIHAYWEVPQHTVWNGLCEWFFSLTCFLFWSTHYIFDNLVHMLWITLMFVWVKLFLFIILLIIVTLVLSSFFRHIWHFGTETYVACHRLQDIHSNMCPKPQPPSLPGPVCCSECPLLVRYYVAPIINLIQNTVPFTGNEGYGEKNMLVRLLF